MSRLMKFFLWAVVFLGLALAADQLLLRVPMQQPALAAIRGFYLDFRHRLLGFDGPGPASIEQAIDQAAPPQKKTGPAPAPPVTQNTLDAPRYLWVDADGTLQFAERLEDIPRPYRSKAKPLQP